MFQSACYKFYEMTLVQNKKDLKILQVKTYFSLSIVSLTGFLLNMDILKQTELTNSEYFFSFRNTFWFSLIQINFRFVSRHELNFHACNLNEIT